jgi:UDP-glucose 4-epimerase
VFDFYKQLLVHPTSLSVLGDGHQRKSYLYVQDCVDAILTALEHCDGRINVLNLGTDEYVEVNESIAVIADELKLTPELSDGGGVRGWSVRLTLRWLQDNPWVLSYRD